MSETIQLTDEQSKQLQEFFDEVEKSAKVAIANLEEIDDETWKRQSFHDKLARYRIAVANCNPQTSSNHLRLSKITMTLQQLDDYDILVEPHADLINVLCSPRAQEQCFIDWQEPDEVLRKLMPGWRYAMSMRSKDRKAAEMYEAGIVAREMGNRTGLCAGTIDADLNIEWITRRRPARPFPNSAQ
jgi:hypothetical protein